ncbi:SIMPL domain-containing protein [Paracoccus pacificus]|uniref:SIMPL domain-containing protein n=1 Tax=Paracoccus pacificus TaxID=1463598 RepID=A0ABW4RA49_9RHOB
MFGRLTVSGQGEATVAPDIATISLGVTTQAGTAAQALSDNNVKQQAILDKLTELGFESRDVQTSGLNLNPLVAYAEGKAPQVTGYQAQNIVTAKVRDLAKLGEALDALVAAGANEMNGLTFGRDDDAATKDEARAAAVEDARQRAQVYADAAGMKLGPILSMTEVGDAVPGPQPMMMRDAAAQKVPIAQGELSINAAVNVTFALLPEGAGDGPEDGMDEGSGDGMGDDMGDMDHGPDDGNAPPPPPVVPGATPPAPPGGEPMPAPDAAPGAPAPN